MNIININNKNYSGNTISINKNKIFIDGVEIINNDKEINITIDGNIDKVSVDSCNTFKINGKANTVKTMSGDVIIDGDISGDVNTMSGDVECKSISGNVKTMSGDIKTVKN
jgi:hypothetical protein